MPADRTARWETAATAAKAKGAPAATKTKGTPAVQGALCAVVSADCGPLPYRWGFTTTSTRWNSFRSV
ncbi:hypothetical protein GCM10027590_45930 [Nocardiopsis nanhaiensis]